jgi:2-polyprenyl-3-methyl-5-hydroxy-6-metoxy-1,4-benzoquinol methylase
MSCREEIYSTYLDDNDGLGYLKVSRGNQESYADNYRDLLPADTGARILEIGCGAGQLLYYIRSEGYKNIEGVDIGSSQIGILEDMGIKGSVIQSIPAFMADKERVYDLIIMNYVIEHFTKEELWENLQAVHKALKSGGRFVFSTCNMACVSGLFQRYIDLTHEIAFTERSAYQIMRVAGFKEIVIRADRIRFKFRPKRMAWWLMSKVWHAILILIYFIERGTDRPKVISRALIVSGKKP